MELIEQDQPSKRELWKNKRQRAIYLIDYELIPLIREIYELFPQKCNEEAERVKELRVKVWGIDRKRKRQVKEVEKLIKEMHKED